MRIIGYIEHPVLKISVFKMEHKFSVKFESGFAEQIYKFRQDDNIQHLKDIQNLIDEAFIQKVESILQIMHQERSDLLERKSPQTIDTESFEEII
jgi:hypothetical protein